MSEPVWVYVSGPYTSDPVANTRAAVRASVALREAGYVPICPHLSMLADLIEPRSYDFWIAWDLELLARCDCLLRLPGVSPGADIEVEHAWCLGIPVHYGIEDMVEGG